MNADQAKQQRQEYNWLLNENLTHTTYNAAMRVTELEVEETAPGSSDFYVCCKLKGKLGQVSETLSYVLENYEKK